MSWTAIERKIDYTVTGGAKPQLFEPINVKGFNTFSLQFFLSAIAAMAFPNGRITLKVSNIDSTVPPPDADFFEVAPGTTTFSYSTQPAAAGASTRYIFVGLSEGVGNVCWVTASFAQGTLTAGKIDKMILSGDMGNS